MSGFYTMFKTNFKLLLRNKGYLAFLILLPILAVIMLNINNSDAMFAQENTREIHELGNDNTGLLNMTNKYLSIKVYDCSNSKLSDYILKELAKTGSYSVNRYRADGIDLEEAREKALNSVNHSVLGAVIYIPDTFEQEILEGKDNSIVVFEATSDVRNELMKNNLKAYLQSLYRYASVTRYDKAALINLLEHAEKNEITKESVSIEVGDKLNLTIEQKGESSSLGYSLAFLTISFLFSGVFIAATVIDERQNRVYNRFLLSMNSLINYGMVKLLMVLMTVVMQTAIIAVAIKLFVKTDFGISFANYLFLVFCLGLIFNLLSVVIGVLLNNILSSNYIAFLVWCLSCMLAGLYFPLDGASNWFTGVSMLMPQRWIVKAAEMLMAGKNGVYSMFLLVVASYLIVIMSVGLIGLKIRRKE